MGGYRYRMNMTTGQLDLVRGLSGTGTSPVSQKTVYAQLVNGLNSITHSANAHWNAVEVLELFQDDLYVLANDIRSQYIAHISDAGEHGDPGKIIDAVNTIIEPLATDWPTLHALTDDILAKYTLHNDDGNAGFVFHSPNAIDHNPSYTSPLANTSIAVIGALLDLKARLNGHDNDAGSHALTGLHQVAATGNNPPVWLDTLYVPYEDSSDPMNKVFVDSVVSAFVKVTFYF